MTPAFRANGLDSERVFLPVPRLLAVYFGTAALRAAGIRRSLRYETDGGERLAILGTVRDFAGQSVLGESPPTVVFLFRAGRARPDKRPGGNGRKRVWEKRD